MHAECARLRPRFLKPSPDSHIRPVIFPHLNGRVPEVVKVVPRHGSARTSLRSDARDTSVDDMVCRMAQSSTQRRIADGCALATGRVSR